MLFKNLNHSFHVVQIFNTSWYSSDCFPNIERLTNLKEKPLGDLGDQLITFLKGNKSQNSPDRKLWDEGPDSPKYESAVPGIGQCVKIIWEDCKV